MMLKKIINISVKGNESKLILIVVISVILSVLPVCTLNILQRIFNILQTKEHGLTFIVELIILYAILNIAEIIFKYIQIFVNSVLRLNLNLRFSNLILNKVSKLKLRHFEDSSVYDVINRADSQIQDKIIDIFSIISVIITSVGTIILFSMKIFSFKWWIVFVIIIFPIIQFIKNNQLNKKQYDIIINRTNEARKSWYYRYIITNGDNFKELKINNLFDHFIKKFNIINIQFNKMDKNFVKEQTSTLCFLELLEYIVDTIILIFIIKEGFYGRILIGDVMIFVKIITSIKSNFKNILNSLSTIKKDYLYINLFFEFYKLEEESLSGQSLEDIDRIQLKNLSFRYGEKYILKNINVEFQKGKLVAIVGLNGSGKTTLSKIIAGFYDDYEGELLVNGVEFRDINKENYRKNISYMLQDYIKFEATFRENICINNVSLADNDDKLKSYIKRFDLESIFAKGENVNLSIPLGYWFDSGRQISIGQWSKVALLRAYLKNADVLLLDEPNSSLDPLSEYKFSELFVELSKKKIGIIITHRLINIVEKADYVVFVEDGIIKDIDNHERLLIKNKKYYQMYKLQER